VGVDPAGFFGGFLGGGIGEEAGGGGGTGSHGVSVTRWC
jgi:hypothetical protein